MVDPDDGRSAEEQADGCRREEGARLASADLAQLGSVLTSLPQ